MHFNYQLEDLTNPTNIKNTFTKTIVVEGTPTNNKIFNSIYRLDSNISPTEYNFNPMLRTPFELYKNGDLITSGYMQLSSIDINNKKIQYNINLFGGLGDFFYSLAYTNTDDADNVELKLKDLYFQVEENNVILPKDSEFNFNINHQFVYDCFNNPLTDDNTLKSFITFIPSYNGLYDDFDTDKVLVNMRGSNVFPNDLLKKEIEEDGNTIRYGSYYYHSMITLPNKLTEWEIRDLRSYKQRPALRLSKLFRTIANPINNGGYNVIFDPTFFNQDNDLYYKAFIALPLLQLNNEDGVNADKTNMLVTKDMILSTEYSPLQYLLDYCKMFGLYFEKDLYSKTIYIKTRNNYFSGKTIDIDNKIDYSKNVNIKPTLFDTKYYRLSSNTTDTYLTKKYKNNYNVDYGQKRINTNYNFNKNVVDVYQDNIYQNAITTLQSGRYYYKYFTSDDYQAPSWLIDNPTMKLYKYNYSSGRPAIITVDKDVTTDYNIVANEYMYKISINGTEIFSYHKWIDDTKTQNLNLDNMLASYDSFPKICCYSQDNEEQQATDLNNFLVIYNDQANLNYANYIVSDDNDYMFELNDNKACYYYSEEDNDSCKRLLVLPQFTRYGYSSYNIVGQSLDFGKPRELYTPYTVYNESDTIYNTYWQNYFIEQFDKNTKKVTCNVNFDDIIISNDSLKHFYFFDNSYWLLNKIENYSPNTWETIKCEFIKVNNQDSYTKGQHINFNYLMVSKDYFEVDYNEHTLTTELFTTKPWYIDAYSTYITDITPFGSSSGNFNLSFKVNANNDYNVRYEYITLKADDTYQQTIRIKQLPNPATTTLLYGDVRYTDGWIRVQTRTSDIVNEVNLNASGKYEIYAPKGYFLYLMVFNSKGEEVYRTTLTNIFEDKYLINI